jgi:hypothetical protein
MKAIATIPDTHAKTVLCLAMIGSAHLDASIGRPAFQAATAKLVVIVAVLASYLALLNTALLGASIGSNAFQAIAALVPWTQTVAVLSPQLALLGPRIYTPIMQTAFQADTALVVVKVAVVTWQLALLDAANLDTSTGSIAFSSRRSIGCNSSRSSRLVSCIAGCHQLS